MVVIIKLIIKLNYNVGLTAFNRYQCEEKQIPRQLDNKKIGDDEVNSLEYNVNFELKGRAMLPLSLEKKNRFKYSTRTLKNKNLRKCIPL